MLKRYGVGKKDIWFSILYGGVVGLIGVVVFVLFIKMDWSPFGQEKIDVSAPVQQPITNAEKILFYALQYGVFSSDEQAQIFIASDPNLVRALSIPIGEKYYVWSRVAVGDPTSIKKGGASFVKTFYLDSSACTEESLRTLPKWLASENSLKFNFGQQQTNGMLPKDWDKVRTTATSISEDMDIARLHLIYHYISSSKCLNLKFE